MGRWLAGEGDIGASPAKQSDDAMRPDRLDAPLARIDQGFRGEGGAVQR
ncbi:MULTISPECIES: hypothetical protein [Hyphobacterium]|uniref:Uncharacterized protein n=1 Tax=Hyphobacterium vulgare TaxID=1736751 RepID=A0ABV6ZZJ3_9PROT